MSRSRFIVPVEYTNDLPKPPTGFKFLNIPRDQHAFMRYCLIEEHMIKLRPQTDTIPIDIITPDVYVKASDDSAIQKEDAMLFARPQKRTKQKSNTIVKSWLRPSQVLVNDLTDAIHKQKSIVEQHDDQRLKMLMLKRKKPSEYIEDSFSSAKEPPVHPNNKKMKVKSIKPILPPSKDILEYENSIMFVSDSNLQRLNISRRLLHISPSNQSFYNKNESDSFSHVADVSASVTSVDHNDSYVFIMNDNQINYFPIADRITTKKKIPSKQKQIHIPPPCLIQFKQ